MSSTATTTQTNKTEVDSSISPSRWTTAQELCLLQTLIHNKPVGIHKHFRMIAIQQTLLASATIPEPLINSRHVSTTKGIWTKLEALYDLQSLDDREDAIFEGEDTDEDYWREFELDQDRFGDDMWERRLADEEEVWSDEGEVRMRESTAADSEDPRSSPVGSTRGTRSGRRAAGRRLAEVKQEETAASSKGSRRTSKAASPSVKEEEDTEMQDVEDEDEVGSDEADDESGPDETEDDGKKEAKTSRGRVQRRATRSRRARRTK